jgi:hypothetical protein
MSTKVPLDAGEDVGFCVDTPSGVPPIWLLVGVGILFDALSTRLLMGATIVCTKVLLGAGGG